MLTTDLPVNTVYRPLANCLNLSIDLTDVDSIPAQVGAAMEIERWVNRLLSGQIGDDEFLEGVEPILGTHQMDGYISEINDNLINSVLCRKLGNL